MNVRVIAEIGSANHSVGYALEAVKQAAGTGVWGIKAQLFSADTLVAKDAPRYDRLAGPANQWEQFKDALPYEAWRPVFDSAKARGLEVFASCWDEGAVEWCDDWGVDWFKVGSADITNLRLLTTIAETGKNVLYSVGAATETEIGIADRVLDIDDSYRSLIPMACTLSYPCEPGDARLERIGWLRERNPVVGYSDHTRGYRTGALAVAAGATYLEKHFTAAPDTGGDHDFALDKDEMVQYVWLAELAWRMTHSDTPIDQPLPSELPARERARRSLHATDMIEAGEGLVVGENCLFLRPGGGIGAEEWVEDYMGEAVRDYVKGEQI